MNRVKVLSALAALAVGGALAANTAPAAAYTNFNVSFAVFNKDTAKNMIRTSGIPTGVSGLINPASAISPGGYDPATGNATFSLAYPGHNQSASASLTYAYALDNSSPCTYTIKVSENNAGTSFTLHFSSSDPNRCPVPLNDVSSGDGQFTSMTYLLNWQS
jgi:hypothetical protein